VEEDEGLTKLAQQTIQATNKILMTNPYIKWTQKVEVKKVKGGGGYLLDEDEEEAEGQSKEAEDTPRKNNRTEGGKAASRRLERIEEKLDADSGEESVATIQQSNAQPSTQQTSPRRDLRHAMEGVQLPVFRARFRGSICFGMT
jgi:hypothetical protein